jgi:signal transduction histidine kinase
VASDEVVHHEAMVKITFNRHTAAVVVVWVLGAMALSAWQVARFVDNEHRAYDAAFDKAFALIAQRIDQNEALLDGLVALLRSSRDPEFPELRQYAYEMLARYPHLYTVGYQPRVSQQGRSAFEQRMGRRLGQPFRIRDFALNGERAWRNAPLRPVYFPVTFMAPLVPEAQSVIGLDVYHEPAFRQAIDRSSQLGEPLATAPFNLVEGGRGYIYLYALHLPAGKDTAPSQHVISLLIHADRLLAGIAAPAAGQLALHHRSTHSNTSGLIGALGTAHTATPSTTWLPRLPAWHAQRALQSSRQPFNLVVSAQPQWRDIAKRPWAAALGAWSLLALAAWAAAAALQRAHAQHHLAQAQTAQAQRALSGAAALRARSLDELGAGIAHELSQPLTAVVGYSQAALRLLGTAEAPSAQQLDAVREALQASAQQALRAGELMQRLRALVRRQPVQWQTLCLQEVASNAVRQEGPRAQVGGVRLQVHAPTTPITLIGDVLLLEQLLTNLLRNAVEALVTGAPADPLVLIELEADATHCRCTVRDNGPGLSAEQLARAFHPFQSTKPEGIGIGLVVCSAIAQAHGGHIEAISPASSDGAGACFTFTLPLPTTGAATS